VYAEGTGNGHLPSPGHIISIPYQYQLSVVDDRGISGSTGDFAQLTTGPGMDDIIIYQRAQRYKFMVMKDEDISLQRSWYESIYGVSKENIDNSAAADKICFG